MNLVTTLKGKRICVCAGSGGVGKTTVSAAIAMGVAAAGGSVAVLTIDPAKRLADSLGLDALDNELRRVDTRRFTAHGVEMRGELWAAMLDPKRTFDQLIERYAPDRDTYERIIENRVYRELSSAIAGSQEYMAMERLLAMYETEKFDLLVLDTPPSRNALDFLDAPARLGRFVEGRALRIFTRPGRLGLKVAGRGSGLVFAGLKRITGVDLLGDLSEFFSNFDALASGFGERARRVERLIASDETVFLLVCSPEHEPVDEAIFFRRKLREAGLPFGGAIVNKVNPDYRYARTALKDGAELPDDLVERMRENFERHKLLGRRDADNIARLERSLTGGRVLRVPNFAEDIHSVDGLLRVNEHLFKS